MLAEVMYAVERVKPLLKSKNVYYKIGLEYVLEMLLMNGRRSLLRLMKCIDYYRVVEYTIAVNILAPLNEKRILDIGSLDTVFSLYLASKGAEIYCIDIDKKVYELNKDANKFRIKNLKARIMDATELKFPNNYFDAVTAISTIEHILPLKNGDTLAMKELSRVLKIGGIAVITIPYNEKYQEMWRYHSVYGKYLMRRYNIKSIKERLIKPSNLLLKKILYFCDDINFCNIWYKLLTVNNRHNETLRHRHKIRQ